MECTVKPNNHKAVSQIEAAELSRSLILCLTERGDLLNLNEIGILKVLVDNKLVQILHTVMCNARMQINNVKEMSIHTKWTKLGMNHSFKK